MPLIPKVDGDSTPLGQRPLTILAYLYRLWASTRLRDLRDWMVQWVDGAVLSAGGGAGAADAWYETSLHIEEALLGGLPLHAGIADVVKAFDTVRRDLLYAFLSELGLPPLVPLRPSPFPRSPPHPLQAGLWRWLPLVSG